MRPAILALAIALVMVPPAWSLTDEEAFRDLRFNFINPGARSLALGGAFIGLADDATAAQANPAGLSFLNRPEYFGEMRLVDNAANAKVVRENQPTIDARIASGADQEDTFSPTFLSAVTVYDTKKPWAQGVSRQEVLNFETEAISSSTFAVPGSIGVTILEGQGSVDIDVVNINASAGIRVTDKLGIGLSFTLSRLDIKSSVVNNVVDTTASLDPPNLYLEPELNLETRIDDSDEEVVYSLGIIYRETGKWSLGAVYRRGPHFKFTEEIVAGGLDIFDVEGTVGARFTSRLNLPDSYGVGGSWWATNRLMLAFGADHTEYSSLVDGFIPGVNTLTNSDSDFTADDATDGRLGAEYVLRNTNNRWPIMALRGGAFSESDSTIRATTGEGFLAEEATAKLFDGRDTQYHGTIGVGFILKRMKIDVAADFSETDNEYVVSLIYQGAEP
ncbi:MAG: hypothetical protein GY716_14525 [bacterium]|nr:hypothetical protein [bacterium]